MENYGSIDGIDPLKSNKPKELVNKDPSGEGNEDCDPVETPIEEALDNSGFTWVHFRLLLIMGVAIVVDYVELEVASLLGAVLLCEWNLTALEEAIVTAVTYVGMSIGAFVWGNISDRFGRKIVLQIISLIGGTAALCSALSGGPLTFAFFRFFVGFSIGGFHVCYTFVSECFGSRLRARASFFLFVSHYMGSLLGSTLALLTLSNNSNNSWRVFIVLTSVPVFLVFFLVTFFCPESPRYLLVCNKPQEALKIIQNFNKTKNQNITLAPAVVNDRGSVSDLFKNWENALILISVSAAFLILRFENLGVTLLFYENLQNPNAEKCDLFVETYDRDEDCEDLKSSDYLWNILFTNAQLGAAIISTTLSDAFGRRFAIYVTSSFGVVSLGLLYFCMPSFLLTLSAMLSKCLILASIMVIFLYINELFPTYIRSMAVGFAESTSRLGLIASPFVAQFLSKKNYPLALTVYIASGFVAFILLQTAQVETRHRAAVDSDKIDEDLRQK